MTLFTFTILTATLIGLASIAALAYRRRERNLVKGWQEVDLRAMARLFDKSDDKFLAANLPVAALLYLRVLRAIAISEYLLRLRTNAKYAIAMAKQNPVEVGLVETAQILRMEVAKLTLRNWVSVISPTSPDMRKLDELAKAVIHRPRALQSS